MRVTLLAVAGLTLSACGGSEQTETNTTTTDINMMAIDNMIMDQHEMLNGAATMDGNMAVDLDTQNMIMQDMNTNAPDTDLANGM